MEFHELVTFSTIIKHGSFSKAAQILGYSQSAVTIQIKKLEEELGVQLFDRLGKSVYLTEQGKRFQKHVENILTTAEIARKELQQSDSPNGSLHIGTIDSICASLLPDLLTAYHAGNPEVSVSVTTDTPAALLEMLANNEIDILYITDAEINDMRFRRLFHHAEQVFFAVNARHPILQEPPASWEEFLRYPFILTEKGASYRNVLEYLLSLRKLEISPAFESNNTDLMLRMVRNGGGIAFLPEYAMEEDLAAGRLVKLSIPEFEVTVWRQLLVHKDKWISRELQTFLDLVIRRQNSRVIDLT